MLALTGAALIGISVLAESGPSPEPAYAPIGAALMVGALLTARARPGGALTSFVIVPALVAYVRFGAAALPAVACASLVANLVHGVRGRALAAAVALDALAFADAYLLARSFMPQPLLAAGAFMLGFVGLRFGLRLLSTRAGVPLATDRRAEQPGLLIPLALAPLGALPLMTGAWLGDGALLLTLAAVLSLLVPVREAALLAAARAEAQTERDRLARANALHDELVHLITHELKNPLTIVRIYTQLGQRALKSGSTDQLLDCLAGIAQAERTLERLVDNMLDLSKLEQDDSLPPAERLQVADMAYEVVAELEPLAEQKQQTLVVDAPHDLPSISASPVLLREALSNLLSNAVKYTPEGGRVVVSMRVGDEPNSLQLAVADTGIGLSEADLARLFTKFFRSSDPRVAKQRGTGLGLALTHAIVHRMGGKLTAVSELNRGTTFRLQLPISTGGSTRDVVASGHHPAPRPA
jgi:signal transduction histidine kinase